MTKHTPEPWCITPGDLIFVSKVGGRGYVAKMMPLNAPRDRKKGLPTGTSDEMCANARRIVACVNACRGLPTDELEQKGLVAAVGTKLLEVEQQRDELLATLNDLTECYFETTGGELSTPRLAHHLAVYRDAINLVTKHKGCVS